ncbi:MAG: cytochrome b [Pseudomonadota bacterium]
MKSSGKIINPLVTRRLFLLVAVLLAASFPALAQESKFVNGVEIHPVLGPIGVNDHRLPYHLDSILGLLLVAYAIAVALLLNNAQPRARTLGVWAAVLGCVGVAGGILWLNTMGYFEELRPALLPTDPAKPTMMLLLAAAFGISALALIPVAIAQSKRTDVLVLEKQNSVDRYGGRARFFHWTIAVLFLLLIPMGIFTSMIPVDQEYRQAYYVIHKSLGFTVLILAIARLAWLIFSPRTHLDPELKGWERFSAHAAHYALYFFLFAFPVSGFVLSTYGGKLSHFFFWDTPLFWDYSLEKVKLPSLLHKLLLPVLFYLVFLAHVVGALKHQFVDKHRGAFRRMIT